VPSFWSKLLPFALRKTLALRAHRDAVARHDHARQNPKAAQQGALERILQLNQETEFGRSHGFAEATSIERYLTRVPPRSPHEYAPFLEAQAQGAEVLVKEALGTLVEYAERTPLALPLTPPALEHWQWWEALLQHYVGVHGKNVVDGMWLSIPPKCLSPKSAGSKGDDFEQARAGATHGPLPPILWEIDDEEERYYLLLRLALTQPLRVLRAQNPGTLSILADHLEGQAERLLEHLASGIIKTQGSYGALPSSLKPEPERARKLMQLRNADGQLKPHHIWPELTTLICPGGGAARVAAKRLPDRYGDVLCIDPGLWIAGSPLSAASEAGRLGGWALLDGQFVELEPLAPLDTAPIPAFDIEALRVGERYTPIISSHHGLYRYRSSQLVEVTELDERGTPRLAPAGQREARITLEGELLTEHEVRCAQSAACRPLDVISREQCCFIDSIEALPEVRDTQDRPFLSRLFSRDPVRPVDAAPYLCWALEPREPLSAQDGHKLLAYFEQALRRHSSGFSTLRAEQTLGVALLLLRRGSFARRRHQHLANGLPGGHTPRAALLETPLALRAEDIDRTIA